jgi:hypothetical protein
VACAVAAMGDEVCGFVNARVVRVFTTIDDGPIKVIDGWFAGSTVLGWRHRSVPLPLRGNGTHLFGCSPMTLPTSGRADGPADPFEQLRRLA